MTEKDPIPSRKRDSLVGRLLVEFIVVFAGVYGAFLLSDYQEHRRDRKAKLNYLETFKADLSRLDDIWVSGQKQLVDSLLTFYNTEIGAGRRPALKIHPDLDFTVNTFIIQSAFDPGHFGNLSREHLVSINMGSSLISMLEKRIDLYQSECRRFLSGTNVDQRSFYTPDGKLKISMRWYIDDLQVINSLLNSLGASIRQGAIPATDALIKKALEE